jgi:hypothetical protein
LAVLAFGVLDDDDVCQKAVSVAQVLGTYDLLEDIWKCGVSVWA